MQPTAEQPTDGGCGDEDDDEDRHKGLLVHPDVAGQQQVEQHTDSRREKSDAQHVPSHDGNPLKSHSPLWVRR